MALDFGKLNFSTSFNPTSGFPIDARTYFESFELAQAAAATAEAAGSSSTVYYYGQILTVYEEGAVSAYQISGDKTLVKLAETTASGDLEGDIIELQGQVAALQTSVTNITNGTTVVGKASADADGNVISETYATQTTVNGIGGRVTTAEGEIDTLQSTVSGHTSSIGTLESGLSTAEGDITALEGRMDTAEGDISTLQNQIAGLTGAMHFVGTSTTDPTEEGGPTIADHEGDYASGDVCFYGGKEYIYDGTSWREFGDEGEHLTKEVADTYYVPLTRTVNGQALSSNITLDAEDVGADAAGTAAGLIGALDVAEITVGASKTLASISETDGVISATPVDIAIPHTAVTDWDTELAKKQDALPATGTGLIHIADGVVSVDNTEYLSTEAAASTYLGINAKAQTAGTADKVANALTAGSKTFNGSAAVEITADDLGALTEVPQATDSTLGGILIGYTTSGNNVAVQLDESGKAFVTVPAAPTYTNGAGLALSGNEFSIANDGVLTAMIADGAVTNDKIASVDVAKLYVAEGDTFILDGGAAE